MLLFIFTYCKTTCIFPVLKKNFQFFQQFKSAEVIPLSPCFAFDILADFFLCCQGSFSWVQFNELFILTGFTPTPRIMLIISGTNTCMIASILLMFPKTGCPKPSPLLAPFTSPAVSTINGCPYNPFAVTARQSNIIRYSNYADVWFNHCKKFAATALLNALK